MTDWIKKDRIHVWHPYTQMLTSPPPIPIKRAKGVYLYTSNNTRILDGISSWWVNIHGHSHPRLNQALQLQIEKMSQVMFAGFTHENAARLAERLVGCTPENLTKVFFSDDGSTAVEVALKMAYQYWRHRNQPQRKIFLALENAYHGDTFGAMAVGGIEVFHSNFNELFFEVRHARDTDTVQKILSKEGDQIAAVIIEPIVQGAGGMLIWPPESLIQLRELTLEKEIPLIADEVFTGFGRTGKMFACEHGPIQPDLLCLSKGLTGGYLPMGVTLATNAIYESFLSEKRARTFFHGHSFTGNALSCAVGLESLSIFEEEHTLQRIAELEKIFKDRLTPLRSNDIVKEVRGIGALAVIELEPLSEGGYLDERMPDLSAVFLDKGVLLRPLGNTLYFLPPYVITDAEVNWVFDVIEQVLDSAVR